MAERGSCNTSSDGPSGRSGAVALRMVTLRPTVRRAESSAPEWAPVATGAWVPDASEPVFGADLPWEPDPEAAAFLNAPRRPLGFYVAPFGTPPFGNPPAASSSGPVRGRGEASWGPAYPAGA